jgi:hypothetical protein
MACPLEASSEDQILGLQPGCRSRSETTSGFPDSDHVAFRATAPEAKFESS